jgi:hypothetical protein
MDDALLPHRHARKEVYPQHPKLKTYPGLRKRTLNPSSTVSAMGRQVTAEIARSLQMVDYIPCATKAGIRWTRGRVVRAGRSGRS